MQITDLCGNYVEHVAINHDWRSYERCYPALFRHYWRYWAKRSYPDIKLPARTLRARATRIRKRLPAIVERFERLKLPAASLDYVLFAGKGCTNGHAFHDRNRWVVWLPVESYSSDLLVDVFVTHEIAHALHYQYSPRYYFASPKQQRHLGRQLATEGMATYLTGQVLGCSAEIALWGGYLPTRQLDRWMTECRNRLPEMKQFALRYYEFSTKMEFFQANEPADIFKFRGGYLLGNELISEIARGSRSEARKLIGLSRLELDERIQQLLVSNTSH